IVSKALSKDTAGETNSNLFFPRPAPTEATARREYAAEVLRKFATRAYRGPVDEATLDRLVKLAESVYGQQGQSVEAGISQAMVAVLASPSFLFREEAADPASAKKSFPYVDEYSLASRLSYFLWSSMP